VLEDVRWQLPVQCAVAHELGAREERRQRARRAQRHQLRPEPREYYLSRLPRLQLLRDGAGGGTAGSVDDIVCRLLLDTKNSAI